MKQWLLVVATLGLVACSIPSVDDLIEDQKLLAKVVEDCEEQLEKGKGLDSQICQNAIVASKRLVIENTNEAIKSVQKNAQIVLKDLKNKSPEALESLGRSADQVMGDAKKNAEEVLEKAKKLLED